VPVSPGGTALPFHHKTQIADPSRDVDDPGDRSDLVEEERRPVAELASIDKFKGDFQ
jgi:hypothetical protein